MRLEPGGVGIYKGEEVVRYPRLAKEDHRPYPRHLVCACGSRSVSNNVVRTERKRHTPSGHRLMTQAVCAKCGCCQTIGYGGLRLHGETDR